jgi:hypothetical protein
MARLTLYQQGDLWSGAKLWAVGEAPDGSPLALRTAAQGELAKRKRTLPAGVGPQMRTSGFEAADPRHPRRR